jgi:hypothetical protein
MSVRKRTWKNARGEIKEAWVVWYSDQQGKPHIKTFGRKKEADAAAFPSRRWSSMPCVSGSLFVPGGSSTSRSRTGTVMSSGIATSSTAVGIPLRSRPASPKTARPSTRACIACVISLRAGASIVKPMAV